MSETTPGLFSSDTERPVADAASVVLVRGDRPFEVLLVKRSRGAAFMGGMYVFPGGKVDPEDRELGPFSDAAVAPLDPTPGRPLDTAAHYVAACRELFEEAGVLLAGGDAADGWLSLEEPATSARFAEWRRRLRASEVGFRELVEGEGLRLRTSRLAYFAHWITPSRENRRYDTRFFLARMPRDQRSLIDREETVDEAWLTPSAALDAYRAERIDLAPPTLRILEDLSACPDLAALDAYLAAVEIVPILPRVMLAGETIAIVLPWDPEYAAGEGEGLPCGPRPGPSRVLLEGGRWVSR